ncbi:hypothetical protein ACQCN2_20475 [Brevibacillus ginsengisoli]
MKKRPLELCPICRAVLTAHYGKGVTVLWCSRNPAHFRWTQEK